MRWGYKGVRRVRREYRNNREGKRGEVKRCTTSNKPRQPATNKRKSRRVRKALLLRATNKENPHC
jgi:hypothetical protein